MTKQTERAGAPDLFREPKITDQMIEAGEVALLSVLGEIELPWDFSAEELAKQVYRDMEYARRLKRLPTH